MSKINLHNYEAFYLDYIESNLSTEDIAELLLFLENHSDLKDELEGFELLTLGSKEELEIDFSDLKKEITPSNAEEFIIGSIEQQLTKEDEAELALLISKNKKLQQLASRYSKTILLRSAIEFPEKSNLKKKEGILVFMTPLRRVAAVAILLIALIPFFTRETKVEIADNQKPTDIELTDSSGSSASKFVVEEEFAEVIEEPILLAGETAFSSNRIAKKENNITIARVEYNDKEAIDPVQKIETIEPKKSEKIIITEQVEALALNKVEIASIIEPKELIAQSVSEPQTVGEWLNETIRKRVFKDSKPKDDKIAGNELIAGATNLLQEKTNADIAFNHNSGISSTSYAFKVGKFSFSKTKSN